MRKKRKKKICVGEKDEEEREVKMIGNDGKLVKTSEVTWPRPVPSIPYPIIKTIVNHFKKAYKSSYLAVYRLDFFKILCYNIKKIYK